MRLAPTVVSPLSKIFTGISELTEAFPSRRFTIDGRLVGDLGEVVCELAYDLILDEISQPNHDATASDGRRVQIKATFKESLTFKTVPELFLGIKLYEDGTFDEIFNGPGQLIHDEYVNRSGIGEKLLSFPIARLKALSAEIAPRERVARSAMTHE